MKFLSRNNIGDEGAAKLGEGLSNLINLTTLNLNLRYYFSLILRNIYILLSTLIYNIVWNKNIETDFET